MCCSCFTNLFGRSNKIQAIEQTFPMDELNRHRNPQNISNKGILVNAYTPKNLRHINLHQSMHLNSEEANANLSDVYLKNEIIELKRELQKSNQENVKLQNIIENQAVEITRLGAQIILNDKIKNEANIIYGYTNHEVRNLVHGLISIFNKIGGNTTVIPEEFKVALTSIRSLVNELSPLLDTSLDLAKIFQDKMKLEQEYFAINDLQITLYNQFIFKANEKKITLNISCDKSIPTYLQGDVHRLNQILTNLISNAIKFTDQGSIDIKIGLVSINSSDVILKFSVLDTGKGIAPEELKNIKQPFQQANSSIARVKGGTGLGLYISELFIKLMNDENPLGPNNALQINSEVGQGTEFTFCARFCIGFASPSPVDHKKNKSLLNLKILIADDDKISRKIIQENLSVCGANITMAENGQDVLNAVKKEDYDAVLLDMNMPVKDGLTTAMELMELKKSGHRKIPTPIACTGNVMPVDIEHYRKAGIEQYLSKPFDFNRAVTAILANVYPNKNKLEHSQSIERSKSENSSYKSTII
jgi:two-component system, sensor histidine kinase